MNAMKPVDNVAIKSSVKKRMDPALTDAVRVLSATYAKHVSKVYNNHSNRKSNASNNDFDKKNSACYKKCK